MKLSSIRHEFVDCIPDELDEGVLYITVRYRTAAHLCACGCGLKVVTPIKPKRWVLQFDGDTVSLWPSIGRWQLPCQSHYVIEDNSIRWARVWTEEQIEAGRRQDALDIRKYYASRGVTTTISQRDVVPQRRVRVKRRISRLGRAWRKLRGD